DELSLFPEWYVRVHRQVTLDTEDESVLAHAFATLASHNARAGTVFVHRDFHSPNLIIHNDHRGDSNPGIIDYQDAVAGPITYD
ncbi:phosphotransferase, partial [Pseudomonas shirazica]|uniref:phosphotransferase n=1 Tax=Pseudomonas shirazica TaxID=1940636 RepID=UPI0015D64ABB